MVKFVRVNEKGYRIGDDHQNAKYTDGEIEMVLVLRDGGMSYGRIAKKMEMPKGTVRDICKGNRRCQTVDHWKTVNVMMFVQGGHTA